MPDSMIPGTPPGDRPLSERVRPQPPIRLGTGRAPADAYPEPPCTGCESLRRQCSELAGELGAARAGNGEYRERLAQLNAELADSETARRHYFDGMVTAGRQRDEAVAQLASVRRQLDEAAEKLFPRIRAARDRYRAALEAIATSDGTCGAKAREALEATT